MKTVIDSSGWIEYFLNGPNAEYYSGFIKKLEDVVTPSVVVYEVYKVVKREMDEDSALAAVEILQETQVVPMSLELACEAADISLDHGLAMGDAIIYATAQQYKISLCTSDKDFEKLPGVKYISADEA